MKIGEIMSEKPSFLKNHIDTLAIIGVNIAIAAILVSLWISNSHRIDAANTRTDSLYAKFMESQEEHNRKWNETNEKFYALLREKNQN